MITYDVFQSQPWCVVRVLLVAGVSTVSGTVAVAAVCSTAGSPDVSKFMSPLTHSRSLCFSVYGCSAELVESPHLPRTTDLAKRRTSSKQQIVHHCTALTFTTTPNNKDDDASVILFNSAKTQCKQ